MSNYKLSDFVEVPILIKTIRNRKNCSQKKLGSRVGVSEKTISAYERGKITPPLETFIKLLSVGGYSLDIKEDIYKTPKKLTIPLS